MVEYYEPDAKDYYDTTEGQSYYMCCRDVFTNRADAGVISIVQTESSYFGGAHGGYYIVPYNFDTSTGDLLDTIQIFLR